MRHLVCRLSHASKLVAISVVAVACPSSAQASSPTSVHLAEYTVERIEDGSRVPPIQGQGSGDPNKPLSKELQKQNGILSPPDTGDPDIRKPVPEDFESDMPVIQPPAAGKDQSFQPK